MRKLLLVVCIFPSAAYAQVPVGLATRSWALGQSQAIYGNPTKRLEGSNTSSLVTNVGYQTLESYKKEIVHTAQVEKWPESEKRHRLELLHHGAKGGFVHFYLVRESMEPANTGNYVLLLTDTLENKLYRYEFESSPAEKDTASGEWVNYYMIHIQKEIKGTFFLYLIPKAATDKKKYKFRVMAG